MITCVCTYIYIYICFFSQTLTFNTFTQLYICIYLYAQGPPPKNNQSNFYQSKQQPFRCKFLNQLEGIALPVQDLEVQVITTDSSWDEFPMMFRHQGSQSTGQYR